MKRIFFTLTLFCVLSYSPAYSAEKMRIAVLDLQSKNISKILSNAVSDLIRSEMIKSGMSAEATFEIETLKSATMILKDGVVRRGGRKFLYLAVDGKVIEETVSAVNTHRHSE